MKKLSSYSIDTLGLAPYRLLGDRVNRWLPLFSDLEKQLLRARFKIAFPAYVAFTLVFPLIGGAVVFILSILFGLLLSATLVTTFLVASTLGIASWLVCFLAIYMYPSMQVDSRKRLLDEEMPYVASHLAVLSRAGLPPEKIFMAMTQVDTAGAKGIAAEEAKDIVMNVRVLGYDIISAMQRSIRNSPSKRFIDFIDGFISVTRSGGNLTAYFLSAAKGFMDSARIAARQLVETLGGIAEVYVSMMVVFPLLIVIMLSVMGIIGGGLGGFSVFAIMQLVTYGIIPMLAIILLLLLDSIMPPR